MWGLEWGPNLKTLLEYQEVSGEIPKALQSKPSLDKRQRFYYDVFTEISSDRGQGQYGPLALTTADLLAYCTLYGIDDIEQRATIARQVKALDTAYLEMLAKKRDKDKES